MGFFVFQVELHERLAALGLVPNLRFTEGGLFGCGPRADIPFRAPTYMDDITIPLTSISAMGILDALQIAAAAIV